MGRKRKIVATICALALTVTGFGIYTDHAGAASLPVTSDDVVLSQVVTERGAAKGTDTKTQARRK